MTDLMKKEEREAARDYCADGDPMGCIDSEMMSRALDTIDAMEARVDKLEAERDLLRRERDGSAEDLTAARGALVDAGCTPQQVFNVAAGVRAVAAERDLLRDSIAQHIGEIADSVPETAEAVKARRAERDEWRERAEKAETALHFIHAAAYSDRERAPDETRADFEVIMSKCEEILEIE